MPSWRFLSIDAMKNATGVKRRHIPTFFTLYKIDIIYIMLNSIGVELELWNNCAPPLILILISTSSSFRPLSLSPCLLVSFLPYHSPFLHLFARIFFSWEFNCCGEYINNVWLCGLLRLLSWKCSTLLQKIRKIYCYVKKCCYICTNN